MMNSGGAKRTQPLAVNGRAGPGSSNCGAPSRDRYQSASDVLTRTGCVPTFVRVTDCVLAAAGNGLHFDSQRRGFD